MTSLFLALAKLRSRVDLESSEEQLDGVNEWNSGILSKFSRNLLDRARLSPRCGQGTCRLLVRLSTISSIQPLLATEIFLVRHHCFAQLLRFWRQTAVLLS